MTAVLWRITLKSDKFGYDTYLSPFTWRYGSEEMRSLFSELNYRAIWRKIWVALAESQAQQGLLTQTELDDIKSKASAKYVDIKRAHEIEKRIKHDVMAEILTFAEQAKEGGGKIHLGATSADIEDNADVIRIRQGLEIILTRLVNCLSSASKIIRKYSDLPCIGWTHLQPGEPTTVGYRIAFYAQDIVLDIQNIKFLLSDTVKAKGLKGAVGTSASYTALLGDTKSSSELEQSFLSKLNLPSFNISNQTYPRKTDFLVLSILSSIAQTANKFANDLRLMQSPVFGEWSEPIAKDQVGSTAMPFKKNPTSSERICSIARFVASLPQVGYWNASLSLLERTLDDSASRRLVIPEGFLGVDEILMLFNKILGGLKIYEASIDRNLNRFASFAGTEKLLMRLTTAGENRQKMHELIRKYSFLAWDEVLKGRENPLVNYLIKDKIISSKFKPSEIKKIVSAKDHVGNAPTRCKTFLKEVVTPLIKEHSKKLHNIKSSGF